LPQSFPPVPIRRPLSSRIPRCGKSGSHFQTQTGTTRSWPLIGPRKIHIFPAASSKATSCSTFQRNGIKKPFKIDFDEYDDDITFFGLKKLNLNNFDLSPDFMREKLLHDFGGKYVAALRSVYVRLYVNGAFYGLYLAVEQPDCLSAED
jgi:hypothetical protein